MKWMWLLLAGATMPAHAQTSDLPPAELVIRALDAQPGMEAAGSRVDAARAEGEALRRGPHEIAVEGSLSRRTIDGEGAFAEYDASLSRSFRLPGKAALDRRAGGLVVNVARAEMALTRRNAALTLADLWYSWLGAAELHRNALKLVEHQQALVRVTGRRVELRDASQLDLEQASAALALAEAQAQEAAAKRDHARAMLATRFAEMPLPADPPRPADPVIALGILADLETRIVESSPRIGTASRIAERDALLAQRAGADRIADPTLGVRLFSERGGVERGAGVVASLPLGGGYRRALASQASANASASFAERMEVEREVRSQAAADIAELRARLASWRASQTAVERAERSTELTARGQSFGAVDLSDLLYAERQANEARAQEIAARVTAARLITNLRIEAGLLWSD